MAPKAAISALSFEYFGLFGICEAQGPKHVSLSVEADGSLRGEPPCRPPSLPHSRAKSHQHHPADDTVALLSTWQGRIGWTMLFPKMQEWRWEVIKKTIRANSIEPRALCFNPLLDHSCDLCNIIAGDVASRLQTAC